MPKLIKKLIKTDVVNDKEIQDTAYLNSSTILYNNEKLNEILNYQNEIINQAFTQETKTGSDITYDNTINARFTNFKIKGNAGTSTEQSFEICGKNLLKLQNKYIYPNNKAILNIKNGKISFVNDSNKQYIGFYITNGNIKNVVKGYTNTKKYYISADVTVTSPTTIQLIGKNISVEENKKTRISADYPENSTNAITFYDMGGNNDDTERTVTFENIQICTQEDYNYEPYQGQTLPLTLPTATGDFTIENKDNNWYYNDTIITDKTLLQQLTNLSKSTSYSGITNIITTADVPAELEVTALTK